MPIRKKREKQEIERERLEETTVAGVKEEGGEAATGRLHLFLSSVFSTIFGHSQQEQEEHSMASRNQQPHQIPSSRGVGALKNQNNRRALGDIGNLVRAKNIGRPAADTKPGIHISRPVTRSFGAQLRRNGQPAENPPKREVKQQGKQKPTSKPKPKPIDQKVIEISPDTKSLIRSKKKVHTLTSVLAARSKAACDIDAPDQGNPLAVPDYVEEIYKFYKISETWNRPGDYLETQTEINHKMRAILADWLIEVHHRFELMPETLYLAFYVIDRYLTLETVLRRELQLVGLAAMLIACKYEEIWAPEVNDFICISDRAYSRDQILAKEKMILDKLEWNLTVPTAYVFLVRFLKAAVSDQELEHMVFFLAELGLMQYSIIPYSPSMFAASAVYAANCALNRNPLWNETLELHTGFSEQQIKDCAKLLAGFHSSATESKLKVVYKKYSSSRLGAVALKPPASILIEEFKGPEKEDDSR